MSDTTKTNAPEDLARDLESHVEEIENDLETSLAETKPEDYDEGRWTPMRDAISAMRERLAEMERMLDDKLAEAEQCDPDDGERRYASYWE